MNGVLTWLGQNIAFAMALFAMLGTAATAYFGYKQRKDVSGDREADQEQEIRNELRGENKDLKAQVRELETQNATLKELLATEREHTKMLTRKLEERDQQISEMAKEREVDKARIRQLERNVNRLTDDVTELREQASRKVQP